MWQLRQSALDCLKAVNKTTSFRPQGGGQLMWGVLSGLRYHH